MWTIVALNSVKKQLKLIKSSNYSKKVNELLQILAINPLQNPPPYEKLQPPTASKYSRRINKQHRLVYNVLEKEKVVEIVSAWTHYE
jgi:Txe/YoeB family toxin of toxin-antitoxin system